MRPLRQIAILVLAGTLSACAALKSADAPATMRLTPRFDTTGPMQSRSIAVAPVRARGFTGQRRYAYFLAGREGEIQQAQTLFWEEAPPQVLERALVDALSKRFAPVAGPGVTMLADTRVVTTLTRFEELSGVDASAVVAFEALTLRDGKLVGTGNYCARAAIADASPTTRARAFEFAIERAVTAFVQASAGTLSATPAVC